MLQIIPMTLLLYIPLRLRDLALSLSLAPAFTINSIKVFGELSLGNFKSQELAASEKRSRSNHSRPMKQFPKDKSR